MPTLTLVLAKQKEDGYKLQANLPCSSPTEKSVLRERVTHDILEFQHVHPAETSIDMSRHRFHGDPSRFQVVADYVASEFPHSVKYIADVAGGQGMLSRILAKKYNFECEVVDPRGWVLKGVQNHQREFDANQASYYDLIIGLHPDGALRAVAESARFTPAVLIPCCNFWSEEKLGRDQLIQAIEEFYQANGVTFKRVVFQFNGPKNIGLVSRPPR